MSTRILTCIVCPRGCTLSVELGENNEVRSVTGNLCPRGNTYAEAECTHPVRTVTTTMRTEDGEVIACKTATTVPKETIFEVMRHINETIAPSRVKIGTVLIDDVANTGVAVISTANKE